MDTNQVKDEIQKQVHTIWINTGRQGTVSAGTGFGKSRLAVMEVERMSNLNLLKKDDVLLVTPTEKLRDVNWPDEFKRWNCEKEFDAYIKPICFASLKKETGNHYKLVILDEIHRLTDLAATAFQGDEDEDALTGFFSGNLCDAVIGLTATVPDSKREPEKARIIAQVAPVIFSYSLDQGVEDGMIADYEIKIIECRLNSTDKNIQAGTKDKPFMTTEAKQYEYLEKNIRKFRMLAQKETIPAKAKNFERLGMFATMARNRFISNLKSKTEMAKRCLAQINPDRRTLVFCGGIDQCNELLGDQVFHSKSGSSAFERFNRKEISVLGVVNAANEGINFTDLDQSLILQIDSNSRNLVQRIGRNLRPRKGHKATIWILVVQETADERWLKKALEEFDSAKISYYSAKSVPI